DHFGRLHKETSLSQACVGACNETVRQERFQGCEGSDAQEEARHAEKQQRQEGEEPQAGHRDRPFRGTAEGKEGAAQEEVARGRWAACRGAWLLTPTSNDREQAAGPAVSSRGRNADDVQ